MGGGLLAFLHAELKPGTELLLEATGYPEKIKGADLIITGEGKADRQTAMGKVPYGILKEAQKEHIPVIVLAGCIENLPELNKAGFKGIFSIFCKGMGISIFYRNIFFIKSYRCYYILIR